jgi:MinD-like ATPase involved in chromosome partitioning or flagellar assembly
MSTSTEHGARPVPLPNAATSFTVVPHANGHDTLRPSELRGPVEPIPDDRGALLELARRPVRRGALVPVVGWEGGTGRTTITRLLATAFARLRGEDPVIVDAVPMWGGLTANADQTGEFCAADVASMSWPASPDVMARLMTTIDAMPLLPGPSPVRGMLADPAALLTAVGRISSIARLTFIDTVADVAGAPGGDLLRHPSSSVVWVASASRAGLWGVAEALTYYRAVGAKHIARRSVVAVVGGRRHWPADAAAAEAQIAGLGVETVRFPHSGKPLTDSRCRASAERLLAAVIARAG